MENLVFKETRSSKKLKRQAKMFLHLVFTGNKQYRKRYASLAKSFSERADIIGKVEKRREKNKRRNVGSKSECQILEFPTIGGE